MTGLWEISHFAYVTACFPLTVNLSLREREQQAADACLAIGRWANSVPCMIERQWMILPLPRGEYAFSAPTKHGRSAAFRPLHRPPVPGARENPQRHRDCATRKRRKRRAPFPRATTTVNTYRRGESQGEGCFVRNKPPVRHLFLHKP